MDTHAARRPFIVAERTLWAPTQVVREGQRVLITIWRRHRGIISNQPRPDDSNWTGAEVRACGRLAALLDVPLTAAAQNVVPVAVTAGESVERLRNWASGRCLDADKSGIFNSSGGRATARAARRVSRSDPSQN